MLTFFFITSCVTFFTRKEPKNFRSKLSFHSSYLSLNFEGASHHQNKYMKVKSVKSVKMVIFVTCFYGKRDLEMLYKHNILLQFHNPFGIIEQCTKDHQHK